MGKILFPGYYPCGEFISNGGVNYTPLNLENLTAEMAVYWRVKKWKATIVVTPGPNYSSGPIGTFYQYGYWNANTEEDLCCHNATYFQNDPLELGGDNPWASSYFGFAFSNEKPYIIYSYNPIDEGHWQTQTSIYNSYYNLGTLSIENFSPSIVIAAYSSPEPNDGWEASLSVSIRADEYWSFGGTYNTQTGEHL